jgi:hypothetical protein
MPQQELTLRDIHLPPAVSWWPPAPGWWILAGTLLAVGCAGLYWARRRRRSVSAQALALRVLAEIEREFRQTGDSGRLLGQVSGLLRRVAMTYSGRERVAGLTGAAWLRSLDELFQVNDFSNGAGQVLAQGPYAPQRSVDVSELLRLCHTALASLPIARQGQAAETRL